MQLRLTVLKVVVARVGDGRDGHSFLDFLVWLGILLRYRRSSCLHDVLGWVSVLQLPVIDVELLNFDLPAFVRVLDEFGHADCVPSFLLGH